MLPTLSQNPIEFAKLLSLYKQVAPMRVLEIGTHEGGTLHWWLRYARKGSIIGSIDVQRIEPERYESWRSHESVKVIWHTGKSQSLEASKWTSNNLYPIDFLFIDGGHTYSEVVDDWRMYSPMVRKGGIIAFHDVIPHPNPIVQADQFWKDLKESKIYNKTEEFFENIHENINMGIGVVYV